MKTIHKCTMTNEVFECATCCGTVYEPPVFSKYGAFTFVFCDEECAAVMAKKEAEEEK